MKSKRINTAIITLQTEQLELMTATLERAMIASKDENIDALKEVNAVLSNVFKVIEIQKAIKILKAVNN